MGHVAAVVGASGYAGGELLRLLAEHPAMSVGPVFGASSAGQCVDGVHRHLPSLRGRVLEDLAAVSADPEGALAGAEVAFLALPHGHSGAIASAITAAMPDGHPLLVDLGADHRLTSALDWGRHYGPDAASHQGTWTYGLPEVGGARRLIEASRTIANPGCYPTAVALAMAPVFAADLVAPGAEVVVVAASGTSGAGRSSSGSLLGSEVMGSMSAYKAGGLHQHTPEMAQTLTAVAGRDVVVSFTPVLAPMSRGILATCSVPASPGVNSADVHAAFDAAYDSERFVTVLDDGLWPRTSDVLGSNSAHIGVGVDEAAARIVVICAIDNLVKGAAGQAIQNANLALGLEETQGLPVDGVAP